MKKWYGDNKCNFCGKECTPYLYDGATILGPWAVMCEDCFNKYGTGIGMGRGQEYQKNEKTGEYEKING